MMRFLMQGNNRRGFLFLLFLILSLSIIAIPALPHTLSADDSESFQLAPLNPAFVEYTQTQQVTLQKGTSATEVPNYGGIPSTVDLSHIGKLRGTSEETSPQMKIGAAPISFNWTTPTNRVTSVKNQLPCGTCWTFGNTAVMESKVWINGLATNADYSEQALNCCTDPSYTALAADRCNTGGNDLMAQDTLIKKGARQETCQPYNTSTINTEACLGCTPTYMTTNVVWVAWADTTPEDITAIKNAIQNTGPVTTLFYYDAAHLYPGFIYYYPSWDPDVVNHVVCIVGWDDTISHPAGGGSGAWLVKNSWGTSWGDNGYFWLCYGSGNATHFGSLRDVKAYDSTEKLYYLDEAGWIANGGYESGDMTTAWMANIFTASPGGNLTHVDFYTGGVNTQYDIRVYRSGNINSLGSAVATKTGTCGDAPGYYSIPLTTPIALSNGEAFTVAVKMTTPAYNYPIPVELVVSGWCNPPIQTGKSYVKHYDADSWTDLASYGQNACLRARVTGVALDKLIGTSAQHSGKTDGNRFQLVQYTAEDTGTISQIHVYSLANTSVKVAIYTDSSGEPGSLITANDSSQPVSANQWNSLSIPDTSITEGTAYWLAVANEAADVPARETTGNSAPRRAKSITYSSFNFPPTAGSGFASSTRELSIAGWGIVSP